jgi:chromosomal replication initiator protein
VLRINEGVCVSLSDAAALWSRACEHLKLVLHPDVYSRWIAVIKPKALTDHLLTLSVDNGFYQTWLEENYLPMIKNSVVAVSGSDMEIDFEVVDAPPAAKTESTPEEKRKPQKEKPAKRQRLDPVLNPKFTFDDFIVGSSNSFAHAASLAVAQAPARAYNPLFIYGGTGLGKTHLMQAIGHYVLGHSMSRVCYLSSEALLNEYIDALQNRTLVQFRKKYRNVDLLLIDDIHFLANKERLQEEFFHTFNALFDAHRQIVMTSDRPASEITGLEQRLVSRFEWGLVTELQPPDLETRFAILRYKMAQTNCPLPEEVVTFIAENVKSNIRRLEGALIRVTSYASLTGSAINIDSLRALLKDTLEQEKQEVLTFDAIQRAVAEHFDIRLADMTSKRRPQAIALPRQVAMYLCRRLTGASLPEIGHAFGKTHATILHAFRSIEKKTDTDPALRQNISQISHKLGKNAL